MLTDWSRREVLTTLSMVGPPTSADASVPFDLLSDWAPDEKVRHRILVENPATLYDVPRGA